MQLCAWKIGNFSIYAQGRETQAKPGSDSPTEEMGETLGMKK